jgi:hypothetical protein
MAAKKTVTAPAASKQGVNKWDEEMAEFAKAAAETEANAGGGNFISTRGGHFTIGGNEVPGDVMNVVIVDHVLENCFYKGKYDAKNPTSPVCYAFGRKEEDMKPHAASSEPQCASCKDCEWNKFGSADTGRGKACKNTRRLGLITEDDLDDVENAVPAILKVPPTSIKKWGGYVKNLEAVEHRPPFMMVTQVSIKQNDDTQFELGFKAVSKVDGEHYENLKAKRTLVENDLTQPYAPPSDEALQSSARSKAKFSAPAKKAAAPAAKSKACR